MICYLNTARVGSGKPTASGRSTDSLLVPTPKREAFSGVANVRGGERSGFDSRRAVFR